MNLTDYAHDAADRGWGPGWPTNRMADMARVAADRSGTAVNVHRRLARLVDMLLDATEARGYLLDQSQTGAFNCRPIAGTNVPSNHSWGLALDLNWRRNPVSYDGRPHTDFPSWLVPMWNDYGFAWGGDYRGDYRDAMHVEFMGTQQEADDLTALAADRLEDFDMFGPTDSANLAAARNAAELAYNKANSADAGVKALAALVAAQRTGQGYNVIRASDSPVTYAIVGSERLWIPSQAALAAFGGVSAVEVVQPSDPRLSLPMADNDPEPEPAPAATV